MLLVLVFIVLNRCKTSFEVLVRKVFTNLGRIFMFLHNNSVLWYRFVYCSDQFVPIAKLCVNWSIQCSKDLHCELAFIYFSLLQIFKGRVLHCYVWENIFCIEKLFWIIIILKCFLWNYFKVLLLKNWIFNSIFFLKANTYERKM
jgi:hypothetical protein